MRRAPSYRCTLPFACAAPRPILRCAGLVYPPRVRWPYPPRAPRRIHPAVTAHVHVHDAARVRIVHPPRVRWPYPPRAPRRIHPAVTAHVHVHDAARVRIVHPSHVHAHGAASRPILTPHGHAHGRMCAARKRSRSGT